MSRSLASSPGGGLAVSAILGTALLTSCDGGLPPIAAPDVPTASSSTAAGASSAPPGRSAAPSGPGSGATPTPTSAASTADDTPASPSSSSDSPTSGEPTPVDQALVDRLVADMTLPHEGRPGGVPDSMDWASGPRLGMGDDPGDWRAITAWGQAYEEAGGSPATNSLVNITGITLVLLHRDGTWEVLAQGHVLALVVLRLGRQQGAAPRRRPRTRSPHRRRPRRCSSLRWTARRRHSTRPTPRRSPC
jgi:hypothetical protein